MEWLYTVKKLYTQRVALYKEGGCLQRKWLYTKTSDLNERVALHLRSSFTHRE
jgi:hypothetical protein